MSDAQPNFSLVNTESINDQIISNKIINQYLNKLEKF